MCAGFSNGQGSRCDFLNFDPQQIPVRVFGHSETYVYTRLPSSSCNNVNLNFINFCFDLARPKSSISTDKISEIAFLLRQGDMFYVAGVLPLLAETSYCNGETVQFQSWSLCCISRRISDFLNITLQITSGVFNYNFALTGPSQVGIASYVAVGYEDFRIEGYITTDRPEARTQIAIVENVVPFLPVLSFSQGMSYNNSSKTF